MNSVRKRSLTAVLTLVMAMALLVATPIQAFAVAPDLSSVGVVASSIKATEANVYYDLENDQDTDVYFAVYEAASGDLPITVDAVKDAVGAVKSQILTFGDSSGLSVKRFWLVTGLNPETNYIVYIAARNPDGETSILNEPFTTLASQLPVVSNPRIESGTITTTTATFRYSLDTDSTATVYVAVYTGPHVAPATADALKAEVQSPTVSVGSAFSPGLTAGSYPDNVYYLGNITDFPALAPGTAYRVYVAAINDDGGSSVVSILFSTTPIPPVITNQKVESITQTSATFKCDVDVAATTYMGLYTADKPAPTLAQLIAGTDAVDKLSAYGPAGEVLWNMVSLTPGTAYVVYVASSCTTGDSAVVAVPFATLGVPICEIGSTQYTTLAAALAAVTNGQTIKLIADVTLSAELVIDNGKTFTVDTNGFKLDFADYSMFISDGSAATFNGCTKFDNLAYIDVYNSGSKAVFNGSLVLDNYLGVYDAAEVTINGNLTVTNGMGLYADTGGKATVNGNVSSVSTAVDATDPNTTVVVNGSVIAGDAGVVCEYGATVTVSGNVTATAADGIGVWCAGSYSGEGERPGILLTQVFVGGNVTASGANSFGAVARNNGQITIDGKITATEEVITVNGDVVDKNPTTLKPAYNQFSDTPNGVLATITAVWVKAPIPPTITGPTAMDLTVGYKDTSTGVFTFTGTSPITVTLSGNTGNGKITFNYETQKIDIAAGLAAGTYIVTLTATNGVDPDAVHTFVLRVNSLPATGDSALPLYVFAVLAAITGISLAGRSVLKKRKQQL